MTFELLNSLSDLCDALHEQVIWQLLTNVIKLNVLEMV